jgi:hypothetical protein
MGHLRHPLRRLAALGAAAALLPLAAVSAPITAPATPQPNQAQSQQQTWFADPPSSVTFTNYYWYIMLASQYYPR